MTKTQQVEARPAMFTATERTIAIDTLLGMNRHLVAVANAAVPFTADSARKQARAIAMHYRADRLIAAHAALAAAA